MRLGGEYFGDSNDPEQIVRAHQEVGYTAAYCPACVIEDRSLVGQVRRAFEAADLLIAEVPAYENLLHPEEAKRKHAFALNCDRLALADEIGARCAGNCLGSANASYFWGIHPDNFTAEMFEAMVDMARAIVDEVQPQRAKMSFETTWATWLDSPENCLRFIEAVDRPSVAIHMDPTNMVSSPHIYRNTTDLIERCFRLLGPYIVCCDAKDLKLLEAPLQVQFEEVVPGQGALDYRAFLAGIARLGPDTPLMLQHLPGPEHYRQAADFVRSVARELGISLPEPYHSAS